MKEIRIVTLPILYDLLDNVDQWHIVYQVYHGNDN